MFRGCQARLSRPSVISLQFRVNLTYYIVMI
jgi:hypothetical protein